MLYKRAKIQKLETLYDLVMLFLKVTSTCTKIPEMDKIPQGRPQKTPEQYRLFLWFLPELGKSPLLKTPDTLVVRYRETKLRMIWKLSSCWLSFIVSGMLWRLLRKKKHQWLYLGVNHSDYNPHLRHAHLHNSDLTIMGITNVL